MNKMAIAGLLVSVISLNVKGLALQSKRQSG